jgi:uncharacterized damage-inducible protein DinB
MDLMTLKTSAVSEFIKDWKTIRGKTYEFIETIPDKKMEWRPHEHLGTFGMQLRHIGVSQRAYIAGMERGKVDFADKNFKKEFETDKREAVEFLKGLDAELIVLLDSGGYKEEIEFHDGVYGVQRVPIEKVLSWLLQHEAYHQGVLTCYGRLAGLGKFRMM